MRQGITIEFGISRSRLRQIWYKCPLQKKIEGSQRQSMAEAPLMFREIFSSTMRPFALHNIAFVFFDSTMLVNVDDSRLSTAA